MLRFLKNYLSDLDKLDIFEQYGSNYVDIASFQHYQTAGTDVEAALIDGIFQFLGLPLRPPIGGIFFLFFSQIFKKVKFLKIGHQLFEL